MRPSSIATASIWLCGLVVISAGIVSRRRVAPEQLRDRPRSMADDRRFCDQRERFLPVFEPQSDRRLS